MELEKVNVDYFIKRGVWLSHKDGALTLSPSSMVTWGLHQLAIDHKQELIEELSRRAKLLEVPEFQEVYHPRTRDNVIITCCIGDRAEALGEYTLPRMQEYADMCRADLVVIEDDQWPEWTIGNKLRFGMIGEHWNRACFIDIDVWINEHAGDIFKQHDPEWPWIHSDVHSVQQPGASFLQNELENMAARHGMELIFRPTGHQVGCWYVPPSYSPKFYNTGVMLMSWQHLRHWKLPKDLNVSHTAEQCWIDLMMTNQFFVKDLDSKWNWLAFRRDFEAHRKEAYFVHLANCTEEKRLNKLLEYREEISDGIVLS